MVGRDGSIDWLALPRFGFVACFAALLGGPESGRWQLAPRQGRRITRRYRPGTLVLETRFETDDGTAVLIDAMGCEDGCADVVPWEGSSMTHVCFVIAQLVAFGIWVIVNAGKNSASETSSRATCCKRWVPRTAVALD